MLRTCHLDAPHIFSESSQVCAYSCLVAIFFVLAVVGETCADTLSDQARLEIGAIMAGAYFMSLVECLFGGLLSWVVFLAVLPPKFDRAIMLFKQVYAACGRERRLGDQFGFIRCHIHGLGPM